jgi:hypothetical protein
VNNSDISGLPDAKGQGLLIWGSGLYRRSNAYLAYVSLVGLENKTNLHYFVGTRTDSDQPVWSTQESEAMDLFNQPQIGEICVSWNRFLGVWLMLYNADGPRGINFRVAEKPWGPWSSTAVLFDPWTDQRYCHFMHASWDNRNCDSVHDPGREREWGGEYGPYVISSYTKGDNSQSTIYFTMSTWNPYNVVLMKSTLEIEH